MFCIYGKLLKEKDQLFNFSEVGNNINSLQSGFL